MSVARRSSSLAFVGLSNAAGAMSTNLFLRSAELAHHREGDLVVVEQDDKTYTSWMQELSMMGGGLGEATAKRIKRVGSGAEAASLASTIITNVPSSSLLQSTYLMPPQSILTSLKGVTFPPSPQLPQGVQTLLVDTSTLDIEVVKSVARQMGEQTAGSAVMLDAPFIGDLNAAKSGKLQFLVGGREDCFAVAESLLKLMGSSVTNCGLSGAGMSVKIINSFVAGINQVALSEGLLLGSRLGLDSKVLSAALNASSGQSWSSSSNSPISAVSPNAPSANAFNGGHPTSALVEEIKLALQSATILGAPLPLGYSAAMLYENVVEDTEGRMKGKDQKDFSVVHEWLKEKSEGGVDSWGKE